MAAAVLRHRHAAVVPGLRSCSSSPSVDRTAALRLEAQALARARSLAPTFFPTATRDEFKRALSRANDYLLSIQTLPALGSKPIRTLCTALAVHDAAHGVRHVIDVAPGLALTRRGFTAFCSADRQVPASIYDGTPRGEREDPLASVLRSVAEIFEHARWEDVPLRTPSIADRKRRLLVRWVARDGDKDTDVSRRQMKLPATRAEGWNAAGWNAVAPTSELTRAWTFEHLELLSVNLLRSAREYALKADTFAKVGEVAQREALDAKIFLSEECARTPRVRNLMAVVRENQRGALPLANGLYLGAHGLYTEDATVFVRKPVAEILKGVDDSLQRYARAASVQDLPFVMLQGHLSPVRKPASNWPDVAEQVMLAAFCMPFLAPVYLLLSPYFASKYVPRRGRPAKWGHVFASHKGDVKRYERITLAKERMELEACSQSRA